MTGWIAISLGDVTGVGPEVTLKALRQEESSDNTKYLLIGDAAYLQTINGKLGINLPIKPYSEAASGGRFFVHNPLSTPLPASLEPGARDAALAAVAWLKDGAQRCLRREMDALVTAPVSKEAIIRAGQPFIGQTEYLSDLAETSQTAMMLLGQDDRNRWLRVVLATTHVPIRVLAAQLKPENIDLAISLAAQSCRDLGLPRCRIAVCGLNPHAGEGGKMGDEEIVLIKPVIEAARRKGLDVHGPFAADTLFHQVYRGDYEVVVAMYHDQGLVPLKMVAFNSGVNWTLGLPFIRTSPDHGTAYDIAGQGKADHSSMCSAIRLAKRLAANRR